MGADQVPRVMTVSDSDSGGGSGIQADLKTFAALRVYGTSVVTVVTAQNTVGIADARELQASLVGSQMVAVLSDIGTDAVKTGILSSVAIVETVAAKVREHGLKNLIVDPVIVARGGDRLMGNDAVAALRTQLVPLARVVTPNAAEAGLLVGRVVETLDDARSAARDIVAMGAECAVVTGGRLDGPATDILYDGHEFRAFTSQRVATTSDLGTGAAFSAAIAAGLARGLTVRDTVSQAKKYITGALRHAFPMGSGHSPIHHLHELWERD